jgi:hypothetical protein
MAPNVTYADRASSAADTLSDKDAAALARSRHK